jgi:hypothetical protein
MANTLTAIMHQILARALLVLREHCTMPRIVNSDYSNEAAEKGDTIDVPIPGTVVVIDVTPGVTKPTPTAYTPTKVQITLDNWKQNEPFALTDKEMVEINKNEHFLPMRMQAAVRAIASAINQDVMAEYKGIYGYVGTAGVTPFASTVNAATDARKTLHQQLAPKTERRGVLDFTAEANALALSQFSDAEKIGTNAVRIEGEIGRKYGIDWYADDEVVTHTAGTITTGLIAKAATAQAVGLTTIQCTTAASTGACALVVGDIILFAGQSQTYVVTAAATQASAATAVNVAIQPPLKVALAGSEAVTVKATHVVNLAFHRDAFALAMRPLASNGAFKGGSEIAAMQDPDTGLVMRLEVSRQHKQNMWELDVLWGAKLVRAELATRIAG